MHLQLELLKSVSSWRKMSVATWAAPDDPTVYGRLEIDMTAVMKFIEDESRRSDQKITVTHVIARAVALALKRYPKANAIIRLGRIYLRKDINVFLQVAVPGDDPDLSGVCIRNADRKKVHEIAAEVAARAVKIRDGSDKDLARTKRSLNQVPFFMFRTLLKFLGFVQYTLNVSPRLLGLPEDPFGSVMVTSVGMLGIDEGFAPIVPISGVPMLLTVGAIKDRPVVIDGQVAIRPVCVLGGTFDHRLIDGVQASILAKFLKEYLADPEKYESEE